MAATPLRPPDDTSAASRVAVVTGASAGVVRATAVGLADAGFDVALLARGEAGLTAAARDVEARGRRALIVPTDVAIWGDVDAAATRIERELGPIDMWLNVAMASILAWLEDVSPEELKRATEVTYLGQVHGTMAALARMRPRDQGTIVNVGSALAFVGIPLQAAYCGAKFACRGFFESVRAELHASGNNVTLSMVHLPAVNTPQFDWVLARLPKRPQPVPPIYSPDTCAEFIIETALGRRRSTIFGVWNRLIVAATRLAPSVVAEYVALSAVDAQQSDEHAHPDRPANLFTPVDAERDFGTHGRFAHRANGLRDRQFLATLPATAETLVQAIRSAAQEKLARVTG